MDKLTLGTVYLLHFERSYQHAQHYMGWAIDLKARLDEHLNGNGGRLMDVITQEGIGFILARTWESVPLSFEKKLKKHKNGRRMCPICATQKKPTS